MLRELKIDIAVDLKGYTGGARPGILAHRPAPVQVHYLGYPGTMGAEYIDYLIADRIVVPEEHRAFYSEQIVYLPDTYQCNDSLRRIADRSFTRASAGLPENGFVFCCFNGSQKIMPETFHAWMDILSKVEGSVLWLMEEHPLAAANLHHEAQAKGVAAERLIFAKRMPLEDHLARLKLADLVLDTLPYGAHTTASDALWVGVPVLTRIGKSFTGRVAASLLNAVGVPELVTHSLEEYEAQACRLAQNVSIFAAMKTKLAKNRETMPLFDTEQITRHLEAAYVEMRRRHRIGERPASFAAV
jgi:protein O-GlcNAc transferase